MSDSAADPRMASPPPEFSQQPGRSRVILVKADPEMRRTLQLMLLGSGFDVRAFPFGPPEAGHPESESEGCLVIEDGAGGCSGEAILNRFRAGGWHQPAVLLGRCGCVPQGDFAAALEQPFMAQTLVDLLIRVRRERPIGR